MIGLFAIIARYGSIIRYYCTYYSPLFAPIIRYYCSLFFLLFSIMAGCLHQENGNVQTAILEPIMEELLVSVEGECLLNCIN